MDNLLPTASSSLPLKANCSFLSSAMPLAFCHPLPLRSSSSAPGKLPISKYVVPPGLTAISAQLARTSKKPPRPRLLLAPMEVLGDRQFRIAQSAVGGADEAVHEFIRVTNATRASIRGVLRRYDASELHPTPLAAQIMGSDPKVLAAATTYLMQESGALRVDLNCGCPARRVNGRGAGAALLLEPSLLHSCAATMVQAANGQIPISVKIRAGYDDITLFDENVRAARDAGVAMLTVHPRTKKQGYRGSADWNLIARAKDIVGDEVQVVGNGDVRNAEDAVRMLSVTGCDHVMIGRGAVANPWIFWETRKAFVSQGLADEEILNGSVERCFSSERRFFEKYLHVGEEVTDDARRKLHAYKIGRLKMILTHCTSVSEETKQRLFGSDGGGDARVFAEMVVDAIGEWYAERHLKECNSLERIKVAP